jgi:hypothetical protein
MLGRWAFAFLFLHIPGQSVTFSSCKSALWNRASTIHWEDMSFFFFFGSTGAWATPPTLFWDGYFQDRSWELFAQAGFELGSSWSLPPEKLGLQGWAISARWGSWISSPGSGFGLATWLTPRAINIIMRRLSKLSEKLFRQDTWCMPIISSEAGRSWVCGQFGLSLRPYSKRKRETI